MDRGPFGGVQGDIMNDSNGEERRRWPRVAPKGTVIVRATQHEQRGRIVNLGHGGVFVETTVSMPERLLGRAVELDVRLDTGRAEWLKCTGRILRLQRDGVAIAFDEISATLRGMIDEAATASRARARVLAVVLIDADTSRRSAMAAGFRATGCNVVEAATPLEAIVRLGESSFEPDVIAVADSYPTAAAEEMRRFIEHDHPRAKLITIGDEVLQPDGIANWLSSSNPDADLTNRIREQLVAPRRPRP